jgi:hypothetical protein
MKLYEIQQIADQVVNDYYTGKITAAEAIYILERSGVLVDSHYFEIMDSIINDSKNNTGLSR